jgi:ubiquinone biosynthesis protein
MRAVRQALEARPAAASNQAATPVSAGAPQPAPKATPRSGSTTLSTPRPGSSTLSTQRPGSSTLSMQRPGSSTLSMQRPGSSTLSTTRKKIDRTAQVMERFETAIDPALEQSGVVRPLPRRKFTNPAHAAVSAPPTSAPIKLHATNLEAIQRSFRWISAFVLFGLGNLVDRLLRRDSVERRAARLLKTFQRVGGTLIKIGQQLSMRLDMLPYAYCRELMKLLDSVKPFQTSYAIKRVEASIGKPLGEVFSAFDPVPIGSASIACVYQAILLDGQKVAVKVRRPGIERTFAADLKVMRWLIAFGEWMTLVRPGLLTNFVREFESTFSEELDFKLETYYQDYFRRHAGKKKYSTRPHYFTAPRVFFDLSGPDVIVQEFTSGIWMWEIVAAVEHNDEAAMERMRELRIDPKEVARRLLWANNWGSMSNVMFHADPHPANIVVKANNQLVFVDFGACGSLNRVKREHTREMFACQARRDIHGMVQSSLGLLEPLPPIDVDDFEKELELALTQAMQRIWSKHAPWYERTSAALWVGFFDLTRKYQLPVNLDTVRVFRAAMLYDTLALRLHPEINLYKEYTQFAKDSGALVRKHMRRSVKMRLRKGLRKVDYSMVADALDTAQRGMYVLKRFLNAPAFNFHRMVKKSVYSVLMVIRLVVTVFGVVILSAAGLIIYRIRTTGQQMALFDALRAIASSWVVQVVVGLVCVLSLRRIVFRLQDRDDDS